MKVYGIIPTTVSKQDTIYGKEMVVGEYKINETTNSIYFVEAISITKAKKQPNLKNKFPHHSNNQKIHRDLKHIKQRNVLYSGYNKIEFYSHFILAKITKYTYAKKVKDNMTSRVENIIKYVEVTLPENFDEEYKEVTESNLECLI